MRETDFVKSWSTDQRRRDIESAISDPDAFFEEHARYDPRLGDKPYAISFLGYGYVSHDTHDLAKRFRRAVARVKKQIASGELKGFTS